MREHSERETQMKINNKQRKTVRQQMTLLSCEDERMLLPQGRSADAIIIGDKSTRTNRSGSDSNTQQSWHVVFSFHAHTLKNTATL